MVETPEVYIGGGLFFPWKPRFQLFQVVGGSNFGSNFAISFLSGEIQIQGARGRYRGTTLKRSTPLLGTYSRTIPRVLCWS